MGKGWEDGEGVMGGMETRERKRRVAPCQQPPGPSASPAPSQLFWGRWPLGLCRPRGLSQALRGAGVSGIIGCSCGVLQSTAATVRLGVIASWRVRSRGARGECSGRPTKSYRAAVRGLANCSR